MKHRYLMLFLSTLLMAACTFDVPLTTEHTIPIDPALLGSWIWDAKEGDDPDTPERMIVMRFSDTEYLIRHIDNNEEIDFRGYAAEIAGVPFIQLELLGDDNGPSGLEENNRFAVVNYKMVDGNLVMNALNTSLVSDELPTTEALRAAFEKHKDHPELFAEPDTARRVEDHSS